MNSDPTTALILTGGGARGAYQAGAVKAIVEIVTKAQVKHPFPIIVGVSAGAINASYLASNVDRLNAAVQHLNQMWSTLHTSHVFRHDPFSMSGLGLRILIDLVFGGLYRNKLSQSLLDTKPLWRLLNRGFSQDGLKLNIDSKTLRAFALTAVNYTTGESETFFAGDPSIKEWTKSRRQGRRVDITTKHVMASASIPLLFPPVEINGHYYADGSMRNYTPLSPAIKLGAERILVVGVRQSSKCKYDRSAVRPSFGRMLSLALNSVLMDGIELDTERFSRINKTVGMLEDGAPTNLRPIDLLNLAPSSDLGEIAYEEAHHLPGLVQYFVNGLGNDREAADLISYVLFEPPYTRRLLKLGYEDVRDQKSKILKFYGL